MCEFNLYVLLFYYSRTDLALQLLTKINLFVSFLIFSQTHLTHSIQICMVLSLSGHLDRCDSFIIFAVRCLHRIKQPYINVNFIKIHKTKQNKTIKSISLSHTIPAVRRIAFIRNTKKTCESYI